MVARKLDPGPFYRKRPHELGPLDVGRDVVLDPRQACGMCGHVLQVARVVRLSDNQYAYMCQGCAVRSPTRSG